LTNVGDEVDAGVGEKWKELACAAGLVEEGAEVEVDAWLPGPQEARRMKMKRKRT